jgi:hypothetical protein
MVKGKVETLRFFVQLYFLYKSSRILNSSIITSRSHAKIQWMNLNGRESLLCYILFDYLMNRGLEKSTSSADLNASNFEGFTCNHSRIGPAVNRPSSVCIAWKG